MRCALRPAGRAGGSCRGGRRRDHGVGRHLPRILGRGVRQEVPQAAIPGLHARCAVSVAGCSARLTSLRLCVGLYAALLAGARLPPGILQTAPATARSSIRTDAPTLEKAAQSLQSDVYLGHAAIVVGQLGRGAAGKAAGKHAHLRNDAAAAPQTLSPRLGVGTAADPECSVRHV